ncbi:hypothetical protein HPB50_004217 [Hyalomma asiaticum]|uniref:Uncharacterized protein n=1 Tax=Hyalomma asiaticum TaxID=266040 RepID=A0ACB7SS91_HYAAI|nr:hypothetical protein HPB50_004217 [Hyalomma asiaticum]
MVVHMKTSLLMILPGLMEVLAQATGTPFENSQLSHNSHAGLHLVDYDHHSGATDPHAEVDAHGELLSGHHPEELLRRHYEVIPPRAQDLRPAAFRRTSVESDLRD